MAIDKVKWKAALKLAIQAHKEKIANNIPKQLVPIKKTNKKFINSGQYTMTTYSFINKITGEKLDIKGMNSVMEFFKIPPTTYKFSIKNVCFNKRYRNSNWLYIKK